MHAGAHQDHHLHALGQPAPAGTLGKGIEHFAAHTFPDGRFAFGDDLAAGILLNQIQVDLTVVAIGYFRNLGNDSFQAAIGFDQGNIGSQKARKRAGFMIWQRIQKHSSP